MKTALSALLLVLASAANASTLTCTLSETAQPTNSQSISIDLKQPLREFYAHDQSLDVGRDSFSFIATAALEENILNLDVIFTEDAHVQDEVANMAWDIDLSQAKEGEVVVQEDLNWGPEEAELMDFSCVFKTK